MTQIYQLGKRGPQPKPKPKKLEDGRNEYSCHSTGVVVDRKQQEQNFVTSDQEIRNLWLAKLNKRPDLYDDACISHGYNCKCCTRVFNGERKK
jgi:hypothetical protein